MKKFIYFAIFILISFSLFADDINTGSRAEVTDIDGNVYQTLIIGNQEWMAENLKVTHYRNGDAIPNLTVSNEWINTTSGAYCVYDNIPANAETYGNLYNWFAVFDSRNIAPEGWHVPTDEEIKELELALGMSQAQADETGWRGTNEGSKLAGRADLWADGNLENNVEFGTSGFSLLPGGNRGSNGVYGGMFDYGYFWSSSEGDYVEWGWDRSLHYGNADVHRYAIGKSFGFSVRCVNDDAPLPVNLSAFYVLYIGGTPTLYWTTQSETENAYWNVYRGTNNEFDQASLLNDGDPIAGQGTTQYPTDYIYVDTAPVVQNTTYWYWIESVATDGESEVHVPITLSIPYEDTPITPDTYGLHQNYPNPFNPSTSISFALEEDSDVELIIYNVKGEVIKSIFNNHVYANDITSVVWDGNDVDGKQVSSGVYFYKLITETKEYQRKMLLVK